MWYQLKSNEMNMSKDPTWAAASYARSSWACEYGSTPMFNANPVIPFALARVMSATQSAFLYVETIPTIKWAKMCLPGRYDPPPFPLPPVTALVEGEETAWDEVGVVSEDEDEDEATGADEYTGGLETIEL